jgi:hypothetical protein
MTDLVAEERWRVAPAAHLVGGAKDDLQLYLSFASGVAPDVHRQPDRDGVPLRSAGTAR